VVDLYGDLQAPHHWKLKDIFELHAACLLLGTLEVFPSHSRAQVPFVALQDFSISTLMGQEFPQLNFPVM